VPKRVSKELESRVQRFLEVVAWLIKRLRLEGPEGKGGVKVLFSGFLREDDQLLSELIRLAAFAGLVARVPYDQDHEPNFGELWEQATEAVQEIRERRREARKRSAEKIDKFLKWMEKVLEYKPLLQKGGGDDA